MTSAGKMGGTRVRLRSFTNSLPLALLRARESMMTRFRAPLRTFNVTEQQWRVLRALSSVEKTEVTVLARATCLLPPSLSRILKDLEDRGLITKTQDMEDLRRSIVSITQAGLAVIEGAGPQVEEIYGEISDAFGLERTRQLQDLLSELEATIRDLPPVPEYETAIPQPPPTEGRSHIRGRPKKKIA